MALRITLKARQRHETIWMGDEALNEIDGAALEDYLRDGEARHLTPFVKAGEEPTVFHWQTLDQDQSRFIGGIENEHLIEQGKISSPGYERSVSFCFRMGVRFPPSFMPAEIEDKATGNKVRAYDMVNGIRMLSDAAMASLQEDYPLMIPFYGKLIRGASFPSAAQKKALSRPSTPQKSSEGQTPSTPDMGEANSQDPPAA